MLSNLIQSLVILETIFDTNLTIVKRFQCENSDRMHITLSRNMYFILSLNILFIN